MKIQFWDNSLDRINIDLNFIRSKLRLPFITIPDFYLRILIASGASDSIMYPDITNNYL